MLNSQSPDTQHCSLFYVLIAFAVQFIGNADEIYEDEKK